MPAVRLLPPDRFFSRPEWGQITRPSPTRGIWLVAHAWLVVGVAAGGAAWLWQWSWWAGLLATPVALALIGGRQLGLAILMHDAAHGALHPNRRVNNFLGQWLTGAAAGSDLIAYRTYHLQHHKFTQQPEDPDLPLSAPFPTSRKSLVRKIVRDLSGQTFWKQRSAQFGFAFKGLGAMLRGEKADRALRDTRAGTPFNKGAENGLTAPASDASGAIIAARALGRFLLVQAVLLAVSLATLGPLPFVLWLIALATTFQLFLRIRNIAEHACTTTGSADPFSHARTTCAGWLARLTVAPYWVNFHSEHHLFMAVPCYRLPRVHRILGRAGAHAKMTIAPNYRSVLRLAAPA